MELNFKKLEYRANTDMCYNFVMQKIEVGKTYKHYKGNMYKIIALAKHSETMEDMVVYSSLDGEKVWVRPKTMWNEMVDNKGTLRFTIVEAGND